MRLRGILRYTGGALAFAALAAGLWLLLRRLRGRRFERRDRRRLAMVVYVAALIQITALRLGLAGHRWLGGTACLVPLATTLLEWRNGPWHFIYHVIGNMIWFVPLGMLLPGRSRRTGPWRVLLAGAALSLAIEVTQFLLGTGISDVDDIWLNALGALAGFGLYRLARRRA